MDAYITTYNFIDNVLENLNLCANRYASTIQDNFSLIIESDIEFDTFSWKTNHDLFKRISEVLIPPIGSTQVGPITSGDKIRPFLPSWCDICPSHTI